jgi:hypothetical protein
MNRGEVREVKGRVDFRKPPPRRSSLGAHRRAYGEVREVNSLNTYAYKRVYAHERVRENNLPNLPQPRYPVRGARARLLPRVQRWFPARPRKKKKSSTNGVSITPRPRGRPKKVDHDGEPQPPRLICAVLRPLLFKTGGRHCVWFQGQVVSRHRSLALALLVRARVESRLLRLECWQHRVTKSARAGRLKSFFADPDTFASESMFRG